MTKKNSSKFFVGLMLILSLGICILGADLMSSYITVGSFNLGGNYAKYNSFDIYFISLASFSSKVEAEEISKTYKRQNAGGFVWNYENAYHILASAYTSENDAIKVKDKLLEISIDSKVIKIKFDEIMIEGNFSQLEKSTLVSSLGIFKETYDKLYDISVSLDTEVSKEIESVMSVSELKSRITEIQSNFNNLFNDKLTTNLLKIKIGINSLLKTIENTNQKDDTTIPYSSRLKYAYLETLNLYYDIVK